MFEDDARNPTRGCYLSVIEAFVIFSVIISLQRRRITAPVWLESFSPQITFYYTAKHLCNQLDSLDYKILKLPNYLRS